MISLSIETSGSTAQCRIAGDLDSYGAATLREGMAALASFRSVVLDLSGVTFIDSAGLGVLVGAVRRIRMGGSEIVLSSPRPAISRVLHMAGLDRIVDIAEPV